MSTPLDDALWEFRRVRGYADRADTDELEALRAVAKSRDDLLEAIAESLLDDS